MAGPIGDHTQELSDVELQLICRAVESRKNEFSTGRILAAKALRSFGVLNHPISKGKMNEPLWPNGFVGSISHNADTCLVAVARAREFSGIGIDLEDSDADIDDISSIVLRKDELTEILDTDVLQRRNITRLAFSAKESVYKAVFPQLQRFIEFSEIRLEFDLGDFSFRATAPDDSLLNGAVSQGEGRYLLIENNLITCFNLPAEGSLQS